MTDTPKSTTPGATGHTTGHGTSEKSAKDMAAETRDAAKERAETLRDKAEETARDAWQTGKAEARAHAEGAQHTMADETDRTATAFRDAGERFDENDYRRYAAEQLADGIGAVADQIRDKDIGDIPGDLTRFARRNPVAFYAGAALLGFAVSRLVKASERNPRDDDFDDVFDFDDDDDIDTFDRFDATRSPATGAYTAGAAPTPYADPRSAHGEASGYAAAASRDTQTRNGFDSDYRSKTTGGHV